MSGFSAGLLLLAGLASAAVVASDRESGDPYLIGERPNPSGPPTVATLGIYLLDIDEIDDVNQRFGVDMLIDISWQDSRLALPNDERTGGYRTLPLNEIWTPRVLIVNDRGLRPQLPLVAEVDDLGHVDYRQRLSGELATDLFFEDFPFDAQRLPIDIISYQYSPSEVSFTLNTAISGDDGSFAAEGWRLRILGPEFGEFTVPAERGVRPRLTYVIEAKRNTRYYLWTMFFPISLIIFMSWTAFWLQPNIVPSRIGISTASIFSLVAFGISSRLSLPRVSYLTRADMFVLGCTLLVFLGLSIAVIGSRWASSDRMDRALRLNAAARWVYAGLFGVVVLITLAK